MNILQIFHLGLQHSTFCELFITIIIDLFPLTGALSQREAPDTIYLLTGSADVMHSNKFRLQQAEA
jgi:hypothetical protein